MAILPDQQHNKLHTPHESGPKLNLTMISLPRSLIDEVALVVDTAMQRLDLNKGLVMCMLAGKPFGCGCLNSQFKSLLNYLVSAALATSQWLRLIVNSN